MLSPEVWSFKPPAAHLTSRTGVIPAGQSLPAKIETFYYNHLVSVVAPEGVTLPKEKLFDDSEYYKVHDLSLDTFVEPTFIDNFVKVGQLTALTVGTRIDCDDCASITPCGKLILSVVKDSYQTLGLQGTPSHYTKNSKKDHSRYLVTVDLRGKQLVQSKKNSDVADCLKTLGKFTFIMIWEHPDVTVCPSSLAKFFSRTHDVNVCSNQHSTQNVKNVKVPVVSYEDDGDVMDVVEWLGYVSLNCQQGSRVTAPFVVVPSVETHLFQGFFTSTRIISFIHALRESFKDQWVSIYVQGFSDSPVNWNLNEHHYYTNGDNGYVFLFNRYKYLFVTNETSKKRYK